MWAMKFQANFGERLVVPCFLLYVFQSTRCNSVEGKFPRNEPGTHDKCKIEIEMSSLCCGWFCFREIIHD